MSSIKIDDYIRIIQEKEDLYNELESVKRDLKAASIALVSLTADQTARTKTLCDSIASLIEVFTHGNAKENINPYYRPEVKQALKDLAEAQGYSTFGYDWLDAVTKYRTTAV